MLSVRDNDIMLQNDEMHSLIRRIAKLNGDQRIDLLLQVIRSTSQKPIKAFCLIQLRGTKSKGVISLYRSLLSDLTNEQQEGVLINVDIDNLEQAVGIPLIWRFIDDERWVVRARAAAILFQAGALERHQFLLQLQNPEIPDIARVDVDRYVSYLKRRSLRVFRQRSRPVSNL